MRSMAKALAAFIPPAMRAQIVAHRQFQGRFPGPSCPCDDCQRTSWEAPGAACDTCNDARFVRVRAAFGEPGWGRAVECPDCTRGDDAERRRMLRAALKVPAAYWYTYTLDRLDPGTQPRVETEFWIAGEHRVSPFLVLNSTERGVGKTHAAAAVAMHWVDTGRRALWYVVPDWLAQMRERIARHADDADAPIAFLARTKALVVLDDLNLPRTDWEEETLFRVINSRFEWGLETVITTNVTELTAPDNSRIWSRVFAQRNSVVWIQSKDRRRER